MIYCEYVHYGTLSIQIEYHLESSRLLLAKPVALSIVARDVAVILVVLAVNGALDLGSSPQDRSTRFNLKGHQKSAKG